MIEGIAGFVVGFISGAFATMVGACCIEDYLEKRKNESD